MNSPAPSKAQPDFFLSHKRDQNANTREPNHHFCYLHRETASVRSKILLLQMYLTV